MSAGRTLREGPLRLRADIGRDAVQVVLEGELDLAGRPLLLDTVAAQPLDGRALRLDLSGLAFMDSTGCRAVLEAHAAARARGAGTVVVIAARAGAVRRLLDLTGLAEALTIEWVGVDDDAD